jgi:hypothetical protein
MFLNRTSCRLMVKVAIVQIVHVVAMLDGGVAA